MDIQGATVVVTGASRGIGFEFALQIAPHVSKLVLISRSGLSPDHLKRLQANQNCLIEDVRSDLSVRSDVESLSQKLVKIPVDILFNNAGLLTGGLLESQTTKEIDDVAEVNFLAPLRLTHAVLPGMIKRGRGKIINHSSISGVMNFPSATTYAATKAGLLAFSRSLGLELKGTGVTTLSLITPGVKTAMFDSIPEKYGAHLDLQLSSVEPHIYVKAILAAIQNDSQVLNPTGVSGLLMKTTRAFPPLFDLLMSRVFIR